MKHKIKPYNAVSILLFIISVLLLISGYIDPVRQYFKGNVYLYTVILYVIIFIFPSVLYTSLKEKGFRRNLNIRFFTVSDLFAMVFGLGLMIFGGAVICFCMYRAAPEAFAASSSTVDIAGKEGAETVNVIYAIVAGAIVPAMAEEFLYRGIVITEFAVYSRSLAVIMSALSFSFIHFSFYRFPVYFFYGIILSLLLFATRSVIACAVVHAANNIFVIFFEKFVYRTAMRQGGGMFMFIFLAVALTLGFSFAFFFALRAIYQSRATDPKFRQREDKIKKRGLGTVYRNAFLSPGFILLFLISIAAMFISADV